MSPLYSREVGPFETHEKRKTPTPNPAHGKRALKCSLQFPDQDGNRANMSLCHISCLTIQSISLSHYREPETHLPF